MLFINYEMNQLYPHHVDNVQELRQIYSASVKCSHLMSCDGVEWSVSTHAPDLNTVVVASTGQVPAIRRPGETTHLLIVTSESGDLVLRHSHVMEDNVSFSATTGQDVLVPGETCNSKQ